MGKKRTPRQERKLRIRSVRREPPDTRRIARALMELAQAQAEADAEAVHRSANRDSKSGDAA
jgi:hypothetical protein